FDPTHPPLVRVKDVRATTSSSPWATPVSVPAAPDGSFSVGGLREGTAHSVRYTDPSLQTASGFFAGVGAVPVASGFGAVDVVAPFAGVDFPVVQAAWLSGQLELPEWYDWEEGRGVRLELECRATATGEE